MNYTIMCLKDNSLDLSYYVSTSEMFNDSLYKSSGAELKFIINMDEYLMVENSIHDSMTIQAKVLDYVDLEEVPDIQSIAPDADISYILEVDLEIPIYLYNYFVDYLLIPEKQIVSED
ncbi:3723_t:CDS:2 [Funneliformis mosseae]|uniref:3723_t:CDS:1 n=1 Tax=Funneliformis mosseae TaxID=27381 RepID=A0A9N9AY45_FUNMO|nr:3723_t:CDS:2 [Funneliformis mosseae]